jgi:serine/threonine protein kinase
MCQLKGGNLQNLIENGSPSDPGAAKILYRIILALTPGHRKGNLRCDFKPASILFDKDGNAYLSDFGIAEVYGDRTDLTFIGATVCILDYISPHPVRVLPISLHMDF